MTEIEEHVAYGMKRLGASGTCWKPHKRSLQL